MSQNKTVIQGLEPADESNRMNTGGGRSNFYSRGDKSGARGTVVPGMMAQNGAANEPESVAPQKPKGKAFLSGKPIVGFLYSVSRTPIGEFWPLHVGQNTIGQASNCDIVLPEGTISSEHAVLVVRKMKNPEKVIASISDARSTNGTMLNGESLGFSAVECKNGDILTFGDNYELFLVLVDTAELGLSVNPNFIPVETDDDDSDDFGPNNRPGDDFPGYDGPIPPTFGGYSPAGGTVGLDGSSQNDKGGTVGM